jgi:hypothetical protein
MDFLDELYLYGETTLMYRGDSTRYVLRQGNAVPAFGSNGSSRFATQEIEDTQTDQS